MSESNYESVIFPTTLDSMQDIADEADDIKDITLFFSKALILYMCNIDEWQTPDEQDPHTHGAWHVLEFLNVKMQRLNNAIEEMAKKEER